MSPKSKTQFQEIRSQSMAAIKQAALELFAHYGYHNTSISQIAKEAGISKGLMYNYYQGKEQLLEAILTDAMEIGESIIQKHVNEKDSPTQQLFNLVTASFTWVSENLSYYKLLTALAFQGEAMDRFESIIKQKTEETLQLITKLFKQMGKSNPEKEALLFSALMDGISLHYMYLGAEYPLEEMKRIVLERFCK